MSILTDVAKAAHAQLEQLALNPDACRQITDQAEADAEQQRLQDDIDAAQAFTRRVQGVQS